MGLKVTWTYASLDDLAAAAEYLNRDSPAFSSSFVFRALEAGRSLSAFPGRGRVVPELENGYSLPERIPDTVASFPLDGAGRFRGDVVDHAVDPPYAVDDPV